MTININRLADTLQTLFTTEAEQAARDSGMIRRQRKISGAGFAQALVFGWLDDPETILEDLANELGMTKQGLDRRLDAHAADCLWRLVRAASQRLFAAGPEAIPVLRRFNGVVIEDCTSLGLPAELACQFPGCGGRPDQQAGQAGMKLLVRFEVTSGQFQALERGAGRDSERTLVKRLPSLSAGSLHLADLGFFDLEELAEITRQGASWISRVPASLNLEDDWGHTEGLADWLESEEADRIDRPVRLGTRTHLDCRLVAVRLPREVARKRLTDLRKKLKKKGRTMSRRQRVLCRWLVLITDLSADEFGIDTIIILYRVRWQIELLFKRWKSLAGLGRSRGHRAYRVLCETYAKLLGCFVQHWGSLLHGGPLSRVSAYRRAQQVHRFAAQIAASLDDVAELLDVIGRLAARMRKIPARSKSHQRPSTRQLLFGARVTT